MLHTEFIHPVIKSLWVQSSCVNRSSLSLILCSGCQYFSCWNIWCICILCLSLITAELWPPSVSGVKQNKVPGVWLAEAVGSNWFGFTLSRSFYTLILKYFSVLKITHQPLMSCFKNGDEDFPVWKGSLQSTADYSRTRRWTNWAFLIHTGLLAIVGRAWPSFVAILWGTNKSTFRVRQYYLSPSCVKPSSKLTKGLQAGPLKRGKSCMLNKVIILGIPLCAWVTSTREAAGK